MRYLITGGTGFIGAQLCRELLDAGHRITVLTRSPERARRRLPMQIGLIRDLGEAGAADAVVNLAGENLAAGRWSEARKRALRESRIGTTQALLRWMDAAQPRPRVLVSASAIGYYGLYGDDATEDTPPGEDFAACLCRDWEATAQSARELGVRVCILRLGVVLGRGGGALARMLPAFRFGLGGPLGDGRQWMSWVHRDDVLGLIRWCVDRDPAQGAYNATAPNPVSNAQFARTLGRALRRPALLRVPAPVLRGLLGEMAELLLAGRRVLPKRTLCEGYAFRFPTLEAALAEILV